MYLIYVVEAESVDDDDVVTFADVLTESAAYTAIAAAEDSEFADEGDSFQT